MHKAVLEDVLFNRRRAVSARHQCDPLGLHIRGEPRVRLRGDIDRSERGRALNPNGVSVNRDTAARRLQGIEDDAHGLYRSTGRGHVTASNCTREQVGSRLDAVTHDSVGAPCRSKRRHSIDLDGVGSVSLDARPHRAKEASEINNLRLSRCVPDHAHALGEYGGHHDVLRPRDCGNIEGDVRTHELIDRAMDAPAPRARTCIRVPRGPSGVDRWDGPRSHSLPGRDMTRATAGQQRTEHQHTRPHLPHHIVREPQRRQSGTCPDESDQADRRFPPAMGTRCVPGVTA